MQPSSIQHGEPRVHMVCSMTHQPLGAHWGGMEMVNIASSNSMELTDSSAPGGEQKEGAASHTAGPAVSIRGNPQMKDTRSTKSHPCCSSLGCYTTRAEDASGKARCSPGVLSAQSCSQPRAALSPEQPCHQPGAPTAAWAAPVTSSCKRSNPAPQHRDCSSPLPHCSFLPLFASLFPVQPKSLDAPRIFRAPWDARASGTS